MEYSRICKQFSRIMTFWCTGIPHTHNQHGGFRNPAPGSDESEYNTTMLKVRECVEWGFKDIIQQLSYLDFKKEMMIFHSPIASYYFLGCFFQNLRVCLYGNKTSLYFDMLPMSIVEYLELVDDSNEENSQQNRSKY